MKRNRFCHWFSWKLLLIIVFICSIFSLSIYSQQKNDNLPLNTVIGQVACLTDTTQSYALFLPPDYSPDKKWPIIYALDPGARGEIPVKLFQEAAARLGYIVAGSNNSQNGPWEPIVNAIKAMWDDTHNRFSIDEKRVYSAGFSGGARAAAIMTRLIPSPISGCIMCGAGLPEELKLPDVKNTYFIGAVGLKDFNFIEMMDLHQKMNAAGVPHRIIVMDSYHSWPDAEICTRMVEWLEVQAMAAGKAVKNEDYINDIYSKELSAGRDLENDKQFYRAYFHYSQIAPLFQELTDIGGLEKRMEKLSDNQEYYKQSMNDLACRQTELKILGKIYPILLDLNKRPMAGYNEEDYLKELDFSSLIKYSQDQDNPDMAHMVIRLMTQISAQLSVTGWNAMENKDYPRAIAVFSICRKTMESEPSSKQVYYDICLACAYGANGDTQNALKYLKIGVEHGYSKVSFLTATVYFQNIRGTKEFKEIIDSINK